MRTEQFVTFITLMASLTTISSVLTGCNNWIADKGSASASRNPSSLVDEYPTATAAEIKFDDQYRGARPNFGIQAIGSVAAFSGNSLSPYMAGSTSMGFLLEGEYQPAFLQTLGVIGFGPSFGLYPTTGSAGPTSVYEYGGQARYQFKYIQQQVLVPYASLNVESIHYNLNGASKQSVLLAGPALGGALLLNTFDGDNGRAFYRSLGVSRSYLVAEMKFLAGSDSNVSATGHSFFFGVRCEF